MKAPAPTGGGSAAQLRGVAGAVDRSAADLDALLRPVSASLRAAARWQGPHRERFDADVAGRARRMAGAAEDMRERARALRRAADALELLDGASPRRGLG